MSRRFLKSLIACLLAISVSVGCTSFTNPATGGKHLLLVSRDTELGWGKQVYEGLKEKPGFTAPNQRVLNIGKRVVEACDDHTWEYHFEVLNTDVPNAFAAPGGFIFVTNGLLKMATTDDELAGVMAHEAGHIAAKHTAIRMQRAMIAQGLVVGAALAVDEEYRSGTAALTSLAASFLLMGNSRAQEHQADKLGVRYSYGAGYNPEGLATFLGKLQDMEASKGSQNSIPNFMSTHPSTPDRIERVHKEVKKIRGTAGNNGAEGL